jgi:hypothetical protein
MSRSALELVGRFDTRLGAGQPIGAAEDSDFVYRAHRSGVMVLYDPSIVVFHHHGRRDFAEVKLLQDVYNLGNGALYAISAAACGSISAVRSPIRNLVSVTGKIFGAISGAPCDSGYRH